MGSLIVQAVKEVRELLGLSQADLKDLLNDRLSRSYDRHTISRWENGRQPIPNEVMRQIRLLLDGGKREAKVVTFANQKGGVGKTTSALNISSALIKLGYRVLLIDADPQASATSAILGAGIVDVYRQGRTLSHTLLKDRPLKEIIIKEGEQFQGMVAPFDLCASHIELAEVDVKREPGTEGLLREVLDSIKDDYDFIVIDCPPHLGFLTWMALVASGLVFVPVRTEPYDVMGVNLILDTISKVHRRANPRLKVGGILPTQFSARHFVDLEIIEHLIGVTAGKTVVLEPVPSSTAFGNAAWGAKIAVDSSPKHKALQAYVRLAEAIANDGPYTLAKVAETGVVIDAVS